MFFYSIVAITTVFFASAFLNPSPLNFIAGIALFPLVVYFWLKATSPSSVSSGVWSLRFLIIAALLSALGIYAYSLKQKTPKLQISPTDQKIMELTSEIKALREKNSDNDALKEELTKIQEKLDQIKIDETISEILLESSPEASPSISP